MIKVNYIARLGNRLFTYCFGRILAEELGYELVAEPIKGFLGTYKKIRGQRYESPEVIYNQTDLPDLKEILNDKTPRKITVQAYLQRYHYYEKYTDKIRNDWLKLDPLPDGAGPNDIVVSIRLGDFIKINWALSLSFYHNIIDQIQAEGVLGKIFIVSDEINSPLLNSFKKHGAIFIDKDPIDQLRLMKTAGYIVMSTSTFSWWGAFLSSAHKVYFPIPIHGSWSENSGKSHRVNESRYVYIENVPPISWDISKYN